jgi:hypothetical protein
MDAQTIIDQVIADMGSVDAATASLSPSYGGMSAYTGSSQKDPTNGYKSPLYATMRAAGQYRPKQNYLFRVGFEINQTAVRRMRELGYTGVDAAVERVGFVVKDTTLPTWNAEMRSVNYYNLHIDVAVNNKKEPIQMTFLDDGDGNAALFARIAELITMPSSRYEVDAAVNPMERSIGFKRGSTASFELLDLNVPNIFRRCVIEKFYFTPDRSKTMLECWKLDRYVLTSPKIQSYELGRLDYADGAGLATVGVRLHYELSTTHMGQPITSTETYGMSADDLLEGFSGQGTGGSPVFPGDTMTTRYGGGFEAVASKMEQMRSQALLDDSGVGFEEGSVVGSMLVGAFSNANGFSGGGVL